MRKWMCGLVCLALTSGGVWADVVTSVWVGGSAGWNTAGNWNPSGVPAANNETRVEFNLGAGGTVDQDTGGSVTLNQWVYGAEAGSFVFGGDPLVFQSGPAPNFLDPIIQVSSMNPQVVSNDLELLNEVTVTGGEQIDLTLAGVLDGPGAVLVNLPTGGRVGYREGMKRYEGSTRVVNGQVELETDHRVIGNLFLETSNSVYTVAPGGVLDLRSKALGAGGQLQLTGGVVLVQAGGGIGEANADAPRFFWDSGIYRSTNSHEHHAETVWRGGTWTGAVGTLVQIYRPWLLEGPGNKQWQRWVSTASNAAAITWAEGNVLANSNGILSLDAASALTITGNDAWEGGAILVGAAAALVKDGGFGDTVVDGFLENDGRVEAHTGTLRLRGGGSGSHAGVFAAEGSGVLLLFDGGAHNLSDGGSLVADNGAVVRAEAGAVLTFAGGPRIAATDAEIVVQGATMDGTGNLVATLTNGALRFTASALGGTAADRLEVVGPTGTVTWLNNGFAGNTLARGLRTASGISLRFATSEVAVASGVDLMVDGPLLLEAALLVVTNGTASLTASGTLPIPVRSGFNRLDTALHLTNRPLDVTDASLVLGGGGTLTTPISVTNGALTLAGGVFITDLNGFLPTLHLDEGVVSIESNTAWRLVRTFGNQTYGISEQPGSVNAFRLASGTFDHGPVFFTLEPSFTWSGGILSGESFFFAKSNLFLTGPDPRTISNSVIIFEAQTVIDGGTLVMDGSAALAPGNGFSPLVVSNGAVIAGTTTNGLFLLHTNVFDGTAGALTFAVPMALAGSVQVEGETVLDADSTYRPAGLDAHAGLFELADGALLRFAGGEQRFVDGSGWSLVPSLAGTNGTARVVIDGGDVRGEAAIGDYAVDLELAAGSFGGFFTNATDFNYLSALSFTWTGGEFVGGTLSNVAYTQVSTDQNTNIIRVAGEGAKGIAGRTVAFFSYAEWEGTGTVAMTSVSNRTATWIFQKGLTVKGEATVAGSSSQLMSLFNDGVLTLETAATLRVETGFSVAGRDIRLEEDAALVLQGGGVLLNNPVHSPSNGVISFEGGQYQVRDLQVSAGNVTDDTFRVQALLAFPGGMAMTDANFGDFNLRFISGSMSASNLVGFATARFAWQGGSFRPDAVLDTNQFPVFVWGDGKGPAASAKLSGGEKQVLFSRVVLPEAEWTSGAIVLQGESARTAEVFFAGGLVSHGTQLVQSVSSNYASILFIGKDWVHQGGDMDVEAELSMFSESGLLVDTGAVMRLAGGGQLLGMSDAVIDGTLMVDSPVTYTHLSGDPLLITTNGRLSGTGIFDGSVTVDGTLAPGASAGILTVSNITLGADSVYEWEIYNWAKGPGEGFDQLAVSGQATISSGMTIKISVPTYIEDFTGEDRMFEILTSTNSLFLSSVTNVVVLKGEARSASGGRWELVHTNNSLFLSYSLDPYLLWTASNGLAGADALFIADPDGDFWNNGIEFVFGTSPTNAASGGGDLSIRLLQSGLGEYAVFSYTTTKVSGYLNPRLLLRTEIGGPEQTVLSGRGGVSVITLLDVPTPDFIRTEAYVPAIVPVRFGHVRVVR